MMASFFQMNTVSTSGSGALRSNTIANPKGELKAITTRSGLVLDRPSVHMPPPFINLEEDECAEETLTDPKLAEYTIKVPPHVVQKAKPLSLRNDVVHQRDPRHSHIPYPSRMNQEKQQEKDEIHVHKFWQMFKQLHINIILADALILILKYQKMLKALLSNKEKLLGLENTSLNENFSAVILKKLPEKLRDPRKFFIPCGFSELKCKALADIANRAICTPTGIARDVFVPVGNFTFPADFFIVDYESDPRVPLILGRPFLRTAHALIDVHKEEEGKIKESKILIDELGPLRSSDFLPSLKYDSILYEDFSKVDGLPSTNNEDKISISNASLILEDFNPPLYELPFHKEVLESKTLLLFSSENEEKVFNLGILTSKRVHTSLLPKLSHRGPKAFKVIKLFESPMEIFPCFYGEDIHILDVSCLHFYPP
nr:hypothetical protein [Tanacetum cinerariifolium]